MTLDSEERELSPMLALAALASVPHSPRKAFRTVSNHRTVRTASVILVISALAAAMLGYSQRYVGPLTFLFFVQVPYSEAAWIANRFIGNILHALALILAASLVAQAAFKSKEPLRRSVSAIGFWYPYGVVVTFALVLLSSANYRYDAFPALLLLVPLILAYIWLLWLLGIAISASSRISVGAGIASGLVASLIMVAASWTGIPSLIPIAVVYLVWRRSTRQPSVGQG